MDLAVSLWEETGMGTPFEPNQLQEREPQVPGMERPDPGGDGRGPGVAGPGPQRAAPWATLTVAGL